MDQELFDLVFSGELVPGFELAQVKKNIQSLFRIDETKTDVLFSGKAISLKKGLNSDTVNKYRVAMKKAGARVNIVLCKAVPVAAQAPVASTPTAPGNLQTQSPSGTEVESSGGFSTSLGAQPEVALEARAVIDAPDFGVAEMGGDLLRAEEKEEFIEADIDVSQLSVSAQEGNLVESSELFHPDDVDVSIPDLDVAPAGSDVLKPEERKEVEPVVVDISQLSVAEVGGRLSEEKPEAPAAPDVGHITLEKEP